MPSEMLKNAYQRVVILTVPAGAANRSLRDRPAASQNSLAAPCPARRPPPVWRSAADRLAIDGRIDMAQGATGTVVQPMAGALSRRPRFFGPADSGWSIRVPFPSMHGYCSSPVLFENLVIVNGDHDGDAYLVALDRQTGKTVWKTPRENKTRSYSTPIIRQIDGRTQMILSGSKSVASYDPRTGKRHWIIDGPTEQFVASVVYNGRAFVFDGRLSGTAPDGHSARWAWQCDRHAHRLAQHQGSGLCSLTDRRGRLFSGRVRWWCRHLPGSRQRQTALDRAAGNALQRVVDHRPADWFIFWPTTGSRASSARATSSNWWPKTNWAKIAILRRPSATARFSSVRRTTLSQSARPSRARS